MAPTLAATPLFVTSSTVNTNTLTSSSFTPANGEVIVVKLATGDTTVSMGAPTGGSQTYTSRVTVAPGGFRGWAGIYTAVISGSPGAMTIASTPSGSALHAMVIERWTGAQLAGTPATGSGNGDNLTSPSASITTTGTNSVVSWTLSDVQSVDPATRAYLNSATEDGLQDSHVAADGVIYFAYQTAATAGSKTFGLSAPTGLQWVAAGIEVQAGAVSNWTYGFDVRIG
jgi:hypothetical protein